MRWDFARYVIGTNSASASDHWLSVPITDPRWQSPQERAETFRRSLDPDLQEAFNELWTRTRTIESFTSFVNSGAGLGSDETDRSALPFAVAEPRIDPELEAVFVAALSDEQRTAYEDVKTARGTDEPRLDLDMIQRYVLWRVFDLGWTLERFGDLDWGISSSNSYSWPRHPQSRNGSARSTSGSRTTRSWHTYRTTISTGCPTAIRYPGTRIGEHGNSTFETSTPLPSWSQQHGVVNVVKVPPDGGSSTWESHQ